MRSKYLSRKYFRREYKFIEWKRRDLLRKTYDLLDVLEGRSAKRNPYDRFPFNILPDA